MKNMAGVLLSYQLWFSDILACQPWMWSLDVLDAMRPACGACLTSGWLVSDGRVVSDPAGWSGSFTGFNRLSTATFTPMGFCRILGDRMVFTLDGSIPGFFSTAVKWPRWPRWVIGHCGHSTSWDQVGDDNMTLGNPLWHHEIGWNLAEFCTLGNPWRHQVGNPNFAEVGNPTLLTLDKRPSVLPESKSRRCRMELMDPRCEPWCWNIYLHHWAILMLNVGKYSSTMEKPWG